jgi:hypothetical protein
MKIKIGLEKYLKNPAQKYTDKEAKKHIIQKLAVAIKKPTTPKAAPLKASLFDKQPLKPKKAAPNWINNKNQVLQNYSTV